ncbi:hypothetical protein AMEX_G13667 [Astyanax mexicanus]|uniref:Uncharacterized protein n=1 Tax=Astyanax mexicanus TaxID=7994 RepID=A0A8T2LM33_ASTMX|nr:hypothetical protein AMEX_G13667 [Astyanax mexicanus]
MVRVNVSECHAAPTSLLPSPPPSFPPPPPSPPTKLCRRATIKFRTFFTFGRHFRLDWRISQACSKASLLLLEFSCFSFLFFLAHLKS